MNPTRLRVVMSCASTGLPKIHASPSEAGSRPVSIFIVVVLPQPFEPRKPKISPLAMSKLTLLTATKSPKRRVRLRARMAGSASVGKGLAAGGILAGLGVLSSCGSSSVSRDT